MPRLLRIFVWVLAALWLPAALHCAIDRAGLLVTAPVCCDDGQPSTADADSCDTRCELLDSGTHQTANDPLKITAPTLLPTLIGTVEALPPPSILRPVFQDPADAPLEISRTWQFVARAALAPRAP